MLNEWKSQASQENDLAGLKEKMTKIDSVTVKNSETNVPHQLINLQPQLNKLETTTSLTKGTKNFSDAKLKSILILLFC